MDIDNHINNNIKIHDEIYNKYTLRHDEIYNPIEQERLKSTICQAIDFISSNSHNDLLALDVGCGAGNFYAYLKSFFLNSKYVGIDFNIKLTKEWKMNNNIVLNLAEKKLMFYELEFKRSLHCWDFSFIMRPIGLYKGFSLKINLSKPSLQSMKITQSTRRFHY